MKIDCKLLRKQAITLEKLIKSKKLTKTEIKHLEGIANLIATLALNLGEKQNEKI